MEKGLLIVVSGPAGSGKGTVNAKLLATGDFAFSVSATTRPPRPGEQDGVHYYFISKERFEELIAQDAFIEYDNHAKNYYGTPVAQLQEKLDKGHVILDIEPAGAGIVRGKRPDATLIFILPPSEEELERRLRGRGDTSEEQIQIRLERAKWEMQQRSWYDHLVINDDADACAERILEIIAHAADEK